LHTPAEQVDFLRIIFLNFSWTGHIHFFTQTISVFFFFALFNSSIDWALSLFYKFNCWTNKYFQEEKTNAPAHQSDKYWSVPEKSVKKMQQTCFRILVEHMIGDYKNYKELGTLLRHLAAAEISRHCRNVYRSGKPTSDNIWLNTGTMKIISY
jgi:hypothetical protein